MRNADATNSPSAAISASALAVASTLALGAEGCCCKRENEGAFIFSALSLALLMVTGGALYVAGKIIYSTGSWIKDRTNSMLRNLRDAKIEYEVKREFERWPQMDAAEQVETKETFFAMI